MKAKNILAVIVILSSSILFLTGSRYGRSDYKKEKYDQMVKKLNLTKKQKPQFEKIHKSHKTFHEKVATEKELLKGQKQKLLEKKQKLFLEGASDRELNEVFDKLNVHRTKMHKIRVNMFEFYNEITLKKKNLLDESQRKIYIKYKKNYSKAYGDNYRRHKKGHSCSCEKKSSCNDRHTCEHK